MAIQAVSLRSLMNRILRVIALSAIGCLTLGFTLLQLKFEAPIKVSGDKEKAILAIEKALVAGGGVRKTSPDGRESWYVIAGHFWGTNGEASMDLKPQPGDTVLARVNLGPSRPGCSRPELKTPAIAFLRSIVERASRESGIPMQLLPEEAARPPAH
jgi:hypothetical protein